MLKLMFSAFHSHSRLQRFSDLQQFTLYTGSEKPEIDIMMPPAASETQLI